MAIHTLQRRLTVKSFLGYLAIVESIKKVLHLLRIQPSNILRKSINKPITPSTHSHCKIIILKKEEEETKHLAGAINHLHNNNIVLGIVEVAAVCNTSISLRIDLIDIAPSMFDEIPQRTNR